MRCIVSIKQLQNKIEIVNPNDYELHKQILRELVNKYNHSLSKKRISKIIDLIILYMDKSIGNDLILSLTDKMFSNHILIEKIVDNIHQLYFENISILYFLSKLQNSSKFLEYIDHDEFYMNLEKIDGDKNYFDIITFFKNQNDDSQFKFITFGFKNYTNKAFIDEFVSFCIMNQKADDRYNKLLSDNLDKIIESTENYSNLTDLFRRNEFLYEKYITKFNEKNINLDYTTDLLHNVFKNKEIVSKSRDLASNKDDIKDTIILKEEAFNEVFNMMVNEICETEKIKVEDVEFLSKGSYSAVYKIGTKVIKVGSDRSVKVFPNNPYILKPILRKEFLIGSDNNFSVFIEVVDFVNTKDVTSEDLYQVYKNLRSVDLVWTDIKKENVGILLRDNTTHWKKEINTESTSLGLEDYRGSELLKSGQPVLIDSDFIFDINNPNIVIPTGLTGIKEAFEARYINELNKNNGKKI